MGLGLLDIGAVLAPVANLTSTIVTNRANAEAQKAANDANARLWREQADYNTPAQQMLRLRDAGLNPNLVYGQVADSKMSSAPTMQAPHYEAPRLSLADYAQVANLSAQNAQITANTAKIKQEADILGTSGKARAAAEAEAAKSDAALKKAMLDAYKLTGQLPSDPGIVKTIGAGARAVEKTGLFQWLRDAWSFDRRQMMEKSKKGGK